MNWNVEVLNETVRAEVDSLPIEMRAKLARIEELIVEFGLQALRKPHIEHLAEKLWELRLTGRDGIARALYVTAVGRRVVMVRAFVKKTQQTPRSEIDLALKRAKDVQ
jgi:phage-related protein